MNTTQPKIELKESSNSLVSRRLIYEEDGELKLFELPNDVSFEELIERFEREKGLRGDESNETRDDTSEVGAENEFEAERSDDL